MRRLVGTLLAVAFLVAVSAPAPASAAIPQGAITWSVDHNLKTITVTVKLLLYPSCSPLELPKWFQQATRDYINRRCIVTPEIADAIRDDIAKVWDGHSYKCYKLIFKVDIKIDNDANRFTVPDDRVAVRIDQLNPRSTSFTFSAGATTASWDSDSPSDKVIPSNNRAIPSTWSYPKRNTHTYAHEFGHVLGLHDTYNWILSGLKEGAPNDVMAGGSKGTVDQSTIDRLVKRNGVIPLADLKCDYKIDITLGWIRHHGIKCGGPGGEWVIFMDGTFDLGGAELTSTGGLAVQMDGEPFDGTFAGPYAGNYHVDLLGIPLSRGGDKGTIDGKAVFDPKAGNITFGVDHFTGDYWAETPARSLEGLTLPPPSSRVLPVENGSFCAP